MTSGPNWPGPWPGVVNKVLLEHSFMDQHRCLCATTAELGSWTETAWPSNAGILTAPL